MKVFRWVKEHIAIIQLPLILIALIVGVVFNVSKINPDATIIVLLVFLSVDIVIFCLAYLEPIKLETLHISKINKYSEHLLSDHAIIIKILSKNQASGISFLNRSPQIDSVEEAQYCVFISGGSMSVLQHEHARSVLGSLKPNVKLTIAFSDYSNNFVITYLNKYFGKKKDMLDFKKKLMHESISWIERRHSNIKKICMDVFNPIAYLAVDYDKESTHSVIHAKHYLLDAEGDETVAFWLSVTPESPLYSDYQKQIKIIEEQGSRLAARFSDDLMSNKKDATK